MVWTISQDWPLMTHLQVFIPRKCNSD